MTAQAGRRVQGFSSIVRVKCAGGGLKFRALSADWDGSATPIEGKEMSATGISATSFANYDSNSQINFKKFEQEFEQLGQDLQSGNLTAAEQDFVTLQGMLPGSSSAQSTAAASTASTSTSSTGTATSSTQSTIEQEFNQLGQDLQSGNLTAASQDYAQLQQDFQTAGAEHHHHHHHQGGNQISQLLNQLGQDLQSGDLSDAQQAYATLQQNLGLSSTSNGSGTTPSTASTTSAADSTAAAQSATGTQSTQSPAFQETISISISITA